MKKLGILLLAVMIFASSLALSSGDQDDVNSTESELVNKAAGILEPFFKEATSSTADSSTTDSNPLEDDDSSDPTKGE